MSFQAEIVKALNKLSDLCEKKNPDAEAKNSPHGRLIGMAYFWQKVEAYAEGKKKEAWKNLEEAGFISDDIKDYDPGDYSIGESASFLVTAKVSNPVKRFNADALKQALNKSKYKVPLPVAAEMIEAAKLPGNSSVTKTITER